MKILDRLIRSLRGVCETLPDIRQGGEARYTMADMGLSAFSLFFMQSPSFLAHQRRLEDGQGQSNCQTLFGLDRIPSDNHIRSMLDPASPDHFHPVFASVLAELEGAGGLESFRQPGGHVLIALDGTEYHVSDKVHCPNCSTRKRGKDKTEYFHAMMAATLVAPDHARVVPLEPEFIVPQDGHEKQDCESRAIRRWLERHGPRYARLKPIHLGDDLLSRQPLLRGGAGGERAFSVRLQAVVPCDDRRVSHRHRPAVVDPLGETRARVVRAPLPLAVRCSTARRRRRHDRQLAHDRGCQRGRRRHLPQQLHHRSAHRPGKRRRTGRVRTRPVEDRKRKLQCSEDQWLQPRTQFRSWKEQSRGCVRNAQPIGLRLPHRL
jgi:hypothetical protein